MKSQPRIVAVACALALAGGAQAVGVPGQGTWETTLLGRDINGNPVAASSASAVFLYDTILDVTWLRSANVSGRIDWDTSKAWVNTLSVGTYGGWRLPMMVDSGGPGCDLSFTSGTDCGYNVQTKVGTIVYSEMAHLWYSTLGNKGYYDTSGNPEQPGWGLSNTGDFRNLDADIYWSGLQYGPDSNWAWDFYTDVGFQYHADRSSAFRAMAVRPGDVFAVPEPDSYALMLIGLGGVLVAVRRRPH